MNWIDIAIIIILLINIGLGWYKGLIRSIVNLVSIILGFIFAKLYYLQMYEFLNTRFDLLIKIKEAVSNTFSSVQFPDTGSLQGLSPEQMSQAVGDSEYIQVITEKFFESETFKTLLDNNISSFSETFSSWLANNLLTILSMFTVFIVVFIGIRILGYFLAKIFKLPILNGVNKLSGFLFGVVKGVFFAMIFVIILVIFGPLFNGADVITTLEQSTIGIYFYKYNLIILIFEGMI